MAQKPETVFRNNRVTPFLKTLRHTAYFPIQQMAINGDPDFILCAKGRFVALELKADGEEPRKLQQFKLDEVTRTHGVSLVASPSNWPEVKAKLRALDKGH